MQGAHLDWVFDITWLDDEFLVTGSRDSTVALWRVNSSQQESLPRPQLLPNSNYPSYYLMKPLTTKMCRNAEKIRALLFNDIYTVRLFIQLPTKARGWPDLFTYGK